MLDTIALTLNQMEFKVNEPDKFSPSANFLSRMPYSNFGASGNVRCVQNPTKADAERGNYKPRLTLTKRKRDAGITTTLRIEFSAPKLIFGNNFDELALADYDSVLVILHRKLAEMGITVHKDVLRNASVSAIHYSKNIALTDYSTCSMIIDELEKMNLTKRLDLSKTDYRNEGQLLRCHTNNFELAFYDKIKDLQQSGISEKRAIETDNLFQPDLFSKGKYLKQLEVLRMEVRIGSRTKLKTMLAKLNIKADMTFQALFSADISQKILRHFWQKSTQDTPLLAFGNYKPEDIVQAIVTDSKGKAKPAKILQQLGGLMLVNSIGLRGAKVLMEKQCNSRTWQRLKKELEGLDTPTNMKYSALRNVETALADFEPLKLKTFQTGSCVNKTKTL